MRNTLVVLFCLVLCSSHTQTTGPPEGSLLILGGAAHSEIFWDTFGDLAGGKEQPIVIIPTANSDQGISRDPEFNRLKQTWKERGFTDVTVLHTRDRAMAESPEFVAPIRRARGVYFPGGRQWRLADSYLNTATHEALWDVLDRGGVIGGSSAGATIQGSYLARGDTKTNTIMMGDHEEGLGFIQNVAIDQHVLARNRHYDLFEIVHAKPELLGIGLDENTGIVVRGNAFQVIGESYVLIYDGKTWSAERGEYRELKPGESRFYLLEPGQKYDLLDRRIIFDRQN